MEDLSQLTEKTHWVSRGFTYTYYTSPARDSKPTLVLFHGWPDTARLWAGLINNYLVPNGYGVVALDCLGYGGSSKPIKPEAYAWPLQAADVIQILDYEDLSTVISVGHDWGSCLCQRLYNLYPSRVVGLVMANVAYIPPTGDFDLDTVNRVTREIFGNASYEYWHFYNSADAAGLMDKVPESVYTVAFSDPKTWLDNWCRPGGMREYITAGRTQPTLPFATPEHKADFMARFGPDTEGFASSCCWYKAYVGPVQNEADRPLPEETYAVRVPALYWGAESDFVCRHQMIQQSADAGLLPDLTTVVREGGHWALLERPTEFGQDVLDWLQNKYT
ncbi:hypothetical protein ACO1O0_001322 [Amphichorda felina]